MSKEIDERVVEMRFDNEHFEKNVQTSMSTLDKFNEKLKFKNAGKGFDDIDKAAKRTDLSPLAKSAEKVGLKFNAMYTIADQAFRNITNSAMAAGKRIVSALTIDPVKTGLQEYETKMNAVQVIKANTRGKDTMEDITSALEELNTYADKTIYNFAQMTSNVGKFTAQGFRAKEAATAVKGLANLAAASGASAEDMARATYQMSQALGGTIRMIDWNSLRNANMATVDLKNTLMDLARVNGIAIDEMIAKHGTFEQTLQEGWLTGKMFTEAMNIYSGIYSDAELKAKGFTDAQIENFKGLAAMAESAATEVKTFTQLFDVLKETAQSGWTQTWELIFGDFDTAKAMFTELQVYFGDIINAFSDARNMWLGGALNLKNPWTKIMEKLEASSIGKIVGAFDKVSSTVKDASDKVEYFQKIVNDVWRGDYNNSDTGRFELLEAAGYNHEVVQDLVNKGYNYKLTIEDIEESHKKFGLTLDGNAESLESAGDAAENAAIKFNEITDAQLEQAGLTKDEIKLYRELAEEAERTGVTMLHLVNEMSENDGRTMLIDSIKNAWSGIVTVLTAVRDAWVDVFPPMTVVQLYNIINGIRDFSEYLVVHEETAENLTRTLRGLFAILDIILTVVSLPMKIAFKALTQLLGVLDIDILSVTAVIGDAIVGFRDFIDASLDFTKVFEKIAPAIRKGIDAITEWFGQIADGFQNGFKDIPDNIVTGFIQGIQNGLRSAGEAIVKFGQTIIDKICEVLGIHSPSTVFFAIGGFIVAGLLLGIKTFAPEVWETIKGFGLKCVDIIKQIDFGAVVSAVVSAGATVALLKIADAFQNFSGAFEGVGDMLEDFGKGVKRFLGGIGAKFRAEAIKEIAIAILILVGAIYILTKLDPMAVASALVAIASLVLMLQYLSKNAGTFDKAQAANLAQVIGILIGISISILILAFAMNKLASLNIEDNWPSIFGGLAAAVISLGSIMIAYGTLVKGESAKNIDKAGITILKIAATLAIMAAVMKIVGGMDPEVMIKGGIAIVAFSGIIVGLIAATKLAGDKSIYSTAALISKVGTAMALMAVACKIIGTMSWTEMGKAAVGLTVFSAIVVGLVAVTKLASDKDVSKAGKLISSVGVAMILMALTGKIIATMSWGDMVKAMVGIAALGGIVTGLIAATKLATDKELKKVGFMLLTLSVAIGILGLIAMVLSMMDVGALAKGVGAVAVLGLIMTAMIKATANAQKCIGNLVVMTVAIALMATAAATLSLIDTTKLLASTGSMVAMMGMFTLMIQSTSKISTGGAVKALIGLTVMLGLFAGFAWALNAIPMDNISKNKEAIGMLAIVMTAMSVLLVITAAVGAIYAATGSIAMLGLVGMLAMLGMFIGFAAAINAIPMDTIASKSDALTILTAVMAAMSLVMIATAATGVIYTATAGAAMLGLVGMLAMLGLFVGLAAAINAIPMDTIANKKDALYILIDVMQILGDLLVKIAIVGPLAVIGVAAMAGLMYLIAALGTFAVGVGALMENFPSLQKFLDSGIPVLEQLAYGIGSIISNFASGLFSELPSIGTSLSDFMDEARGFIDGIKMVDEDVLKGIRILTGVFVALTATEFASGISSFVKGIFGESQFENFGKGLVSLTDCISGFADATASFTDDQLEGVKRGAEALKVMAEAAAAIPNSGGWAGAIAGENDIGPFVSMLTDSLEDIKLLLSTLSDTDIDKSTVKKLELVCDVIASMTEAAKELPNTGGVAGFLAGDNDIDKFIKMLGGCVEDLKLFIEGASSVDEGSMTKVQQVIDMLTNVTTVASNLNITSNIATFGSGMNSFATNFRTFCEKMSDLDGVDLNFAIVRLQSFVEFCESVDATTISNIANLGTALENIAVDGYNKFIEVFTKEKATNGAEKAISSFVSTTATNVKTDKNKKKFQKVGEYLAKGLAAGIENGENDVVNAAVAVVKAAESAARTEAQIKSPSRKFMTLGRYIVEGLAKGIGDNTNITEQSMKELTDDLLEFTQDELKINSPSLVYKESVGKWICEGIAKGILKDTSPEDAMKIKLANIFSAYEEYRTNLPEGKTPVAFDKVLFDNGIRSTRTWTNEAKANKKTYAEYMYDLAADYFASGFDGAEQAADDAAKDIDKIFSKSIDTINDKIKSSDLTYKAAKLITFDKDKKIELEQDYLANQIDLKMQLIDEYESKIKEYQLRSNTLEDSYILGIREDILELNNQIAEHEEALATVSNDIASEKAQEIRDSYQSTFDRITKDLEMLDSTYENWVISYPDAKQSVKHSRLFDHLDLELKYLKERESTYKKMVNEIATTAGTNTDEYKAAYDEWVRARADVFNKEEEISDTHEEHLRALEEAEDRARDSEYALWQAKNQNASEQEKLARELKYLEETLVDTEEESARLHEEYLKMVEKEGETSDLTLNALADWNESVTKEAEIRNSIADNKQSALDAAEEANDRLRESTYELYVAENENASDREKLIKELVYIEESLVDSHEDIVQAEEAYKKALTKENANETEINNLLADLNEKKAIAADWQSRKNEANENLLNLAKEERATAFEIAKLKYDIWEKTEGREVKGVSKETQEAAREAKQLEYLNEQLLIQNQFTNDAMKEYSKAVTEYGSDSIEAVRSYKNYLNEVYSLAELKDQILDLEESAADRQKRLKDKQDMAQRDYEDYIKKYEKYYRTNGMTRADLERDAKLVTGYDPAKVVDNITNKTKSALETVTTSVNYQTILTGFTDMGTSYVNALNEGITEQSTTMQKTTLEMVKDCAFKLFEARPVWVQTGKYLVGGLIEGIKARRSDAIKAAVSVTTSMLKAAETSLGIESPSKAFAEVGKYSVLGLVKGLVDNSGLSDDAAARMGDSAIESLKNSIRQISDVVNSDLDTQPTIRPVLDLSNIRSGTARLNAMVSNAQAIAISDSRKARENSENNQNGNDSSTNNGNTYQFTQNNYSPKALSRTEIYRQTKNQFTAMKEVLT